MDNRTGGFDSHTLPPTRPLRLAVSAQTCGFLLVVLLVLGCSGPKAPPGTSPHPEADHPRQNTTAGVLAVAHGEATYYADKFDGRPTASGIRFRNQELYAAHRAYPFGTLLRVTNLKNRRSVVVRVVDRGPNGKSERAQRTIVDLSQRAAQELRFLRDGRVPVRVEVLEWGRTRAFRPRG